MALEEIFGGIAGGLGGLTNFLTSKYQMDRQKELDDLQKRQISLQMALQRKQDEREANKLAFDKSRVMLENLPEGSMLSPEQQAFVPPELQPFVGEPFEENQLAARGFGGAMSGLPPPPDGLRPPMPGPVEQPQLEGMVPTRSEEQKAGFAPTKPFENQAYRRAMLNYSLGLDKHKDMMNFRNSQLEFLKGKHQETLAELERWHNMLAGMANMRNTRQYEQIQGYIENIKLRAAQLEAQIQQWQFQNRLGLFDKGADNMLPFIAPDLYPGLEIPSTQQLPDFSGPQGTAQELRSMPSPGPAGSLYLRRGSRGPR